MAAGATLSIFGARIVASQYRAFCLAQGHNLLSQNPTAPKIPGSVDDQVRCSLFQIRGSDKIACTQNQWRTYAEIDDQMD